MVRNKDKTKNTFTPTSSQAQLHSFIPASSTSPCTHTEWHRRNGELWSVCNSSSLSLLPPHILPLLQRGSFPWAAVLQELFQHESFPWPSVLQDQPAPAWFLHGPQFLLGEPAPVWALKGPQFLQEISTCSRVVLSVACSVDTCSTMVSP